MKIILMLSGIALTVCCWGSYGPTLHRGQANLGNTPLKPLICVGAAYFIVAIIVPLVILSSSGKLTGDWSARGITWSICAGALGAFGALGIILAMTSGGRASFVMPLVFGGAPIVNVIVAMYFEKIAWKDMGAKFPIFLAGVIMVAVGAAIVMLSRPTPPKGHGAPDHAAEAKLESKAEDPEAGKDEPPPQEPSEDEPA